MELPPSQPRPQVLDSFQQWEYSFVASVPWYEMTKSEWASWFQAVASVLAIGIAIYIPAVQHLRDVRMRIEEAHARIRAALRMTYQLSEDFKRGLVVFNVNEDQLFDAAGMQSLRDRLGAIDVQSLPHPIAERLSYMWYMFVQISATYGRPGELSSFDRSNDDDKKQLAFWSNNAGGVSGEALKALGNLDRITRIWPSVPSKTLLDWLHYPINDRAIVLSRRKIQKHLKTAMQGP